LIWWCSELLPLKFQVVATLSQYLLEAFYYNQVKDNTPAILLYVQQLESVFAKKDFDTLPDHHKWDHTIKLVPEAKSKVYSLLSRLS